MNKKVILTIHLGKKRFGLVEVDLTGISDSLIHTLAAEKITKLLEWKLMNHKIDKTKAIDRKGKMVEEILNCKYPYKVDARDLINPRVLALDNIK